MKKKKEFRKVKCRHKDKLLEIFGGIKSGMKLSSEYRVH